MFLFSSKSCCSWNLLLDKTAATTSLYSEFGIYNFKNIYSIKMILPYSRVIKQHKCMVNLRDFQKKMHDVWVPVSYMFIDPIGPDYSNRFQPTCAQYLVYQTLLQLPLTRPWPPPGHCAYPSWTWSSGRTRLGGGFNSGGWAG